METTRSIVSIEWICAAKTRTFINEREGENENRVRNEMIRARNELARLVRSKRRAVKTTLCETLEDANVSFPPRPSPAIRIIDASDTHPVTIYA